MRLRVLAACLPLVVACASRDQPYRFGSPMLGMAQVPPEPLPDARSPGAPLRNRDRMSRDPRRAASAAAASAVARAPAAQARDRLPMPHRLPADSQPPPVRSAVELRALVGRRDQREPSAAALGWARELGMTLESTTGNELVAWAESHGRIAPAGDPPETGDLVVFDRATGDLPFDLVAIVIARDARGVVELVYVGGGVVRRGFLDPVRPGLRRDGSGGVVNTYLRHGKRNPPSGTRYLAGELMSRVVRPR